MNTLLKRMIGAARLDAKYLTNRSEADSTQHGERDPGCPDCKCRGCGRNGIANLAGIAGVTFAALLSWMVWIGLTLVIGKWIMPGPETQTNIWRSFGLRVSRPLPACSGFLASFQELGCRSF